MKKTLVTAFIICSLTANAQDLTGKFFIGGSVGFEMTSANTNPNDVSYSNPNGYQTYSFNPSAGFYVSNKIALGLQLGYVSTTFNYLDIYINSVNNFGYKVTTTTFSIAPLVRYTIPVIDKLGFNLNITLPYSNVKGTSTTDGGTTLGISTAYIYIPNNYTTNSYGVNISPGFQWFVKNNIAILGSLGAFGYTHYTTTAIANSFEPASTTNTNDIRLSLTTGFTLGVTFYFGGSKE